ncbi:Uncharacterised protein g3392 [Pycnogonum litorale]
MKVLTEIGFCPRLRSAAILIFPENFRTRRTLCIMGNVTERMQTAKNGILFCKRIAALTTSLSKDLLHHTILRPHGLTEPVSWGTSRTSGISCKKNRGKLAIFAGASTTPVARSVATLISGDNCCLDETEEYSKIVTKQTPTYRKVPGYKFVRLETRSQNLFHITAEVLFLKEYRRGDSIYGLEVATVVRFFISTNATGDRSVQMVRRSELVHRNTTRGLFFCRRSLEHPKNISERCPFKAIVKILLVE